jgi:hypothetical protein
LRYGFYLPRKSDNKQRKKERQTERKTDRKKEIEVCELEITIHPDP